MSENKLKSRDAIDAELQKTKAELAIAKQREMKLRNQIRGMTEKERRHRNIVWGPHFEYLIRERLNVSKEQLATLDDDKINDYIDSDTELLMCGKCHTKKQTLVTLIGRTMKPSCLCRCKAEELEKEKQKQEERELIECISRLKSAGLQDNTFFGYTFANCDETDPCAGYAHRYTEHFREFQKNGQGLLFWGNVGTGKTFLAGCIANALMEKNIPVLMTSFPKLLNALRNC